MTLNGGTRLYVKEVVFAAGQSLSNALDCEFMGLLRIIIPAAWTAADITVQTSEDGSAYSDLYDEVGQEYTLVAGASRAVKLPPQDLSGVRFLKLRSGSSAAPVAQVAGCTVKLVFKPF